MVSVGCRIAPMLSMIENRSSQNGESLLIFGSMSKKVHQNIVDKIENEKTNGCLTDVLFAWSNDEIIGNEILSTGSELDIEKDTESRIKEVILENKKLIWKYWFNDRTSLYYC